MDDQGSTYNVKLYVYDLSKGLARQLSPMMLGKQLEGIWHTAIVVHGEEFFYGGQGIASCPPCGTLLGEPNAIVDLGNTEVNMDIFTEYLSSLGESTYRAERYQLFEHNCNTFSNEVAQFLTGRKIPSYITDLPSEVLSTVLKTFNETFDAATTQIRIQKLLLAEKMPFGQALRPLIDSVSITPPGNNGINGHYGQR